MSLKAFHRSRRTAKKDRRRSATSSEPEPAPEPSTAIVAPMSEVLQKPPSPTGLNARALMEHFLSGRSKNTLDAYRRDLKAFMQHVDEETIPDAINGLLGASGGEANAIVLGWLNAMTQKGLSSSTRARRLGTIRSFVKLARMLGVVDWTIEIQNPHVENYRDTRGPALDSIHKMLATCGEDLEGKRNHVIIRMLASLGLRRSELVSLRESDYDREDRRMRVVGKGNKKAWVTLPPALAEALDEWLDASRELRKGDNPPLICSFRAPGSSDALSAQGLNYVVSQIGERAGIKAWPHGLRHAGITLGLDSGHDIRDVRRFSRHSAVQTVVVYDDNRKDLGGQVAKSVDDLLVNDSTKTE